MTYSPKRTAIGVAVILLTVFITYLLTTLYHSDTFSCEERYRYLNPELNCINDNTEKMTALQNKLESYVKTEKASSRISIFFRDLKTRRWLGINENESFSPGSLLKVPLAIAYLKYSEINPSILNQQITYAPQVGALDWDSIQTIKPEQRLKSGGSYRVSDLLEKMLKYSDNESMYILSQSIDEEFIKKIFTDLGAYFPTSSGLEQDYLSVKTYASILRSLYLASYLNRETSEKILTLMAESTFKDGLAAGISAETPIAHKFGERQFLDSNGKKIEQLHDCGIIYHS